MVSDLHFDFGVSFLTKAGEELCGDSIVCVKNPHQLIMVLSDGLGSGVKANILSTLTTKIISVMLERGARLNEVTETLCETLPFCKVRKLAYSTFSIVQCSPDGDACITEYDNPPAVFISGGKVQSLTYQTVGEMGGRAVKQSLLKFKEGDWLVVMSDGEVHAGIGGVWNLGWSWERIAAYLELRSSLPFSAQQLADDLTGVACKLYQNRPGDDVSVGVIKVREKRWVTLLIGAPRDRGDDAKVVKTLMEARGKKIVCGGTTGNIVARELNQEVEVDMKTATPDLPPVGVIKGVDLVTEGTLTLKRVLELLRDPSSLGEVRYKKDGASRLVQEVLEGDVISIMVGRSINPAHQNPSLPVDLGLKNSFVEGIATLLRSRGKEVAVSYY